MADLNGVDPTLAGAINAMIAMSGGKIWINSGFRTRDQQAKLYAQNPNLAAPPGHSNHERGLAVDLGGDMNLAHQLAARLGLNFPMSWEPWHIELASTRTGQGTSPNAYTQSPFGDPNPQGDASISQRPDHVLATGVEAMRRTDPLGTPAAPVAPKLPDTAGFAQPGTAPPAPAPSSGGGGGGDVTPGGPIAGGKGSVSPQDLYNKLIAQGLDPAHAAAGVAIASRESGFNASAFNGNHATGDESYGLFQINKLGGQHAKYSNDSLLTVDGSAYAFADLVRNGGLQPWGGYKGVPWYHGVTEGSLQQAAQIAGLSVDQLRGLK